MNGNEVGGGSICIHNPEDQKYVLQDVLKVGIPLMSRGIRFPTMWHSDKYRLKQACAAFF